MNEEARLLIELVNAIANLGGYGWLDDQGEDLVIDGRISLKIFTDAENWIKANYPEEYIERG